MFDRSKVQLAKCFAAIYLVGIDKDGVSVLRVSKMIGLRPWASASALSRA